MKKTESNLVNTIDSKLKYPAEGKNKSDSYYCSHRFDSSFKTDRKDSSFILSCPVCSVLSDSGL